MFSCANVCLAWVKRVIITKEEHVGGGIWWQIIQLSRDFPFHSRKTSLREIWSKTLKHPSEALSVARVNLKLFARSPARAQFYFRLQPVRIQNSSRSPSRTDRKHLIKSFVAQRIKHRKNSINRFKLGELEMSGSRRRTMIISWNYSACFGECELSECVN